MRQDTHLSQPAHLTKQLTNWRAFPLGRLYQAKQQKIQRRELIVCEKSQTFQSALTVRACRPHQQLRSHKHLNTWFGAKY